MVIVACVLAVHLGIGLAWMMQPEQPAIVLSEMSVSVAIRPAAVAQAEPETLSVTSPPPKPAPGLMRSTTADPKPVVQEVAELAPRPIAEMLPNQIVTAQPVVAAAPVVDTMPDYRAGYLNNPRPAYPMVARRMGWEGRVVLNVEVLAEGGCGGVNVFTSSGHEVLDNAALRTVRGWHFTPASRAGYPVTQWFKVPIQFALKENEV